MVPSFLDSAVPGASVFADGRRIYVGEPLRRLALHPKSWLLTANYAESQMSLSNGSSAVTEQESATSEIVVCADHRIVTRVMESM